MEDMEVYEGEGRKSEVRFWGSYGRYGGLGGGRKKEWGEVLGFVWKVWRFRNQEGQKRGWNVRFWG